MWQYGEWGWMNLGMHGLGMLLVWGVIIFAIVAVMRSLTHSAIPAAARASGTPLDILRERYARGELDKDQFATIKKGLEA